MNPLSPVYVAGGDALIGSAVLRELEEAGFTRLVGMPPDEPDLTNPGQVEDFFSEYRPEYVIMAGGRSGGIGLNRRRPADLMMDNLLSTCHVLHSAHANGVKKLLYLASSCAYPRLAPQPLAVESLLAGPVEPTSMPYATAKLAGWQLCEAFRRQFGARFITGIPANAFGPWDDFDEDAGHVIPALIRRAYEARLRDEPELVVWGTGAPRREFIYAPDLARACLFVMENHEGGIINLGGGASLSIAALARLVADVVGYRGAIRFDPGHPDGQPLKMLDSRPLREMGWRPRTEFRAALEATYTWFLHHVAKEGTE
ncbi:MAG: GDP-L-fucose synthase, partial [Gemmataceae bacterium]|nr:GDP-L-fucose synthase [Gemmataceae bacterium]